MSPIATVAVIVICRPPPGPSAGLMLEMLNPFPNGIGALRPGVRFGQVFPEGIRSKQRIYGNGSRAGGQPFSRGALYALLSNPVYIGEIAHKGARYPGQHKAILDRETLRAGPGDPSPDTRRPYCISVRRLR